MDYSALRESGMELIRRWAGESWTDHNVHDPGITILEACSYAMTELGLRLQLDVADLLRSGESNRRRRPRARASRAARGPGQLLRICAACCSIIRSSATRSSSCPRTVKCRSTSSSGGDPPLTYTPGTPRIRPGGLYEVLVELADRELNSNTYSLQVTSGGQNYDIDLALPFWDEPEAAPFREGAVVNTVAMVPDGGEVWRALPEPHSYFGRLDVGYTGPSGAGQHRHLGPAPDHDGAAAAWRRRPGNSRRRAHGGGVHGGERAGRPIRRSSAPRGCRGQSACRPTSRAGAISASRRCESAWRASRKSRCARASR